MDLSIVKKSVEKVVPMSLFQNDEECMLWEFHPAVHSCEKGISEFFCYSHAQVSKTATGSLVIRGNVAAS